MQANMVREGDVVVVRLVGRINVEAAEPFQVACFKHLLGKKTIFNFQHLNFVGSSGIIPFLETVHTFAAKNSGGLKLCGLSSEFKKVFAATPLAAIPIFELERDAIVAFSAHSPYQEAVIAVPTHAGAVDFRALLAADSAESTELASEDDITESDQIL